MRDYKNSKVKESLAISGILSGLCFGLFFYGLIFILLVI